jgi:hypothetical protein
MGEGYTAIIVCLSIVFIIGFVLPFCLAGFIPESSYNHGQISNRLSSESSGQLFPSEAKSFFQTQIAVFRYIPSEIAIPLLIIVLVSLIYGVVKLILP